MKHKYQLSRSTRLPGCLTDGMRTLWCVGRPLRWLMAIAIVPLLLAACGTRGPSVAQANSAIKAMPEFQFLLGNRQNNPKMRKKFANLQLVSDLKCSKAGDQNYKCQVLMKKNPLTGIQQTATIDFAKLGGKWRVVQNSQ